MTTPLTDVGYLQTKMKLAQLEERLKALRARMDLHPVHHAEVERSYEDMMRQYKRDLKLYEASHPPTPVPKEAEGPSTTSR